jgi:hypothetical protein
MGPGEVKKRQKGERKNVFFYNFPIKKWAVDPLI